MRCWPPQANRPPRRTEHEGELERREQHEQDEKRDEGGEHVWQPTGLVRRYRVSSRAISFVVVDQLRIVMDLYSGVPTILPRRLLVRSALSRWE